MDSIFYSYYDICTLFLFMSLWISYSIISYKNQHRKNNLTRILNICRKSWMTALVRRDNRMVDATIINTLRASASFFASTSMLILAGLIAGLASSEKGVSILSTLPFIGQITRELWEIKMLLLILIFTYAFFEFTWSLRMYNFTCILVGSVPNIEEIINDTEAQNNFVTTASHVVSAASMHFNYGMRAYYLSLAALTWFISNTLMLVSSVCVIYILYHREFRSNIFGILDTHINATKTN